MSSTQIRIEGNDEDLKLLHRALMEDETLKGEVAIQPVTSSSPGELREPVLVALVLGVAPVAIRNLRKALERYMEHRETMEALRILGEGNRPIELKEIAPESS